MPVRKRWPIIISLALSLLACQAASRALQLPVEETFTSRTTLPTQATASIIPTSSPQPEVPPFAATASTAPIDTPALPSQTASQRLRTNEIPTITPSPQGFLIPTSTLQNTATPLPLDSQMQIFEELWQLVKDKYLYPDFNGLDWDAIHTEYQLKIQQGLSNDSFYDAMDEMISRLGDDHSVFLSPAEVSREDAEYEGHFDYVGIGVLVSAVPEKERAVVLVTFPGSPAEIAGIKSHDAILAANGEPIIDEQGFLRDILRGPEGTQVIITVESPNETPRQVLVERRRIQSSLPVPYTVFTTAYGKRIGYILLVSFVDGTIDDQVAEALQVLTDEIPLDGLIIDNRENGGGADTVLRPMLSYFTSGRLGYFISRQEERPLEIPEAQDIGGSQEYPLVVLIGMGTASYGEIFAGILQDVGRAYLIGQTTNGNVETLWGYDFIDGSRAWIARESFHPLNHPYIDWELTGIVPDETVISSFDEFLIYDDPAIQSALNHFDTP